MYYLQLNKTDVYNAGLFLNTQYKKKCLSTRKKIFYQLFIITLFVNRINKF